MNIAWQGEGAIKIQTGETSVLVDPFTKASGLAPLRAHVDIICLANGKRDHENIEHIKDPSLVIEGAGEYESRGVAVEGIESELGGDPDTISTFYVLQIEDVNLCHLGAISKELTQKQIDAIGEIDILFVPVGGDTVYDAKRATEIANELEPRIVIPIYYKTAGVKTKRADVAPFLKEIGATDSTEEKTLTIKKHQLPQEETRIVVLAKS